MGAGKIRFGGGEGKVAAFEQETGKKIWEAQVAGKAWSLAIAEGRLIVSTDAGHIYSFGPEPDEPIIHPPPRFEAIPVDPEVTQQISNLLKSVDCQRGIALVCEGKHPQKILELAHSSELQILVLTSKHETANALKQRFHETGYAGRITVHHHQPKTPLPYTDYVFNLIITEEDSEDVPLQELRRVQRPNGGALVWGWEAKRVLTRGPLKEVGEWSHMYANPANTTCSEDQHVGGEMQLQWFGPPGPRQMLDRHLRTVAPLWKNGRMFIPGDNRVIAVDAYNGTPLWNVEVPDSRRVGAYRDCSYIVAGEDSIYVAAKIPVSVWMPKPVAC